MKTVALVKIVFASGYVEEFEVDIENTDEVTPEQVENGIIELAKMHAGQKNDSRGGDFNQLWALKSRKPLSAYAVNTKNVDFVSVSLKYKG